MGSGLPCFPQGSSCPVVLRILAGRALLFAYRAFTVSGGPFQCPSAKYNLSHSRGTLQRTPPTPPTPDLQRLQTLTHVGFGLLPFRSPLLREYSLFLRVLRCFSSPRSPHQSMCSTGGIPSPRDGFPHSGTPGSSPAHGLPGLFAVYRALLRLLSPRHPPSALRSFSRDTETLMLFFYLLALLAASLLLVKVHERTKLFPRSTPGDQHSPT